MCGNLCQMYAICLRLRAHTPQYVLVQGHGGVVPRRTDRTERHAGAADEAFPPTWSGSVLVLMTKRIGWGETRALLRLSGRTRDSAEQEQDTREQLCARPCSRP